MPRDSISPITLTRHELVRQLGTAAGGAMFDHLDSNDDGVLNLQDRDPIRGRVPAKLQSLGRQASDLFETIYETDSDLESVKLVRNVARRLMHPAGAPRTHSLDVATTHKMLRAKQVAREVAGWAAREQPSLFVMGEHHEVWDTADTVRYMVQQLLHVHGAAVSHIVFEQPERCQGSFDAIHTWVEANNPSFDEILTRVRADHASLLFGPKGQRRVVGQTETGQNIVRANGVLVKGHKRESILLLLTTLFHNRIQIRCFDPDTNDAQEPRDKLWADKLVTLKDTEDPKLVLSLVGGLHARKTPLTPALRWLKRLFGAERNGNTDLNEPFGRLAARVMPVRTANLDGAGNDETSEVRASKAYDFII